MFDQKGRLKEIVGTSDPKLKNGICGVFKVLDTVNHQDLEKGISGGKRNILRNPRPKVVPYIPLLVGGDG